MGDDITRVVPSFLNRGGTILDINHTSIILIPKIKKLENMTQFRPIGIIFFLGKFYLVDAGFPLKVGLITPY